MGVYTLWTSKNEPGRRFAKHHGNFSGLDIAREQAIELSEKLHEDVEIDNGGRTIEVINYKGANDGSRNTLDSSRAQR